MTPQKIIFTKDQVDLIESIGYVHQFSYTTILHVPYYFEKQEDGSYLMHKPMDIDKDRYYNASETIEYIHSREYVPFLNKDRTKEALLDELIGLCQLYIETAGESIDILCDRLRHKTERI